MSVLPPPLALAPPELLVDVEPDAAGADDVVLLLLLLLELPQAATPTAKAAKLRARAEILGTWRSSRFRDGCQSRR